MPRKLEEMYGTKSTRRLTDTLDIAMKNIEPKFKPQNEAAKQILAEAAAAAERKTKQK